MTFVQIEYFYMWETLANKFLCVHWSWIQLNGNRLFSMSYALIYSNLTRLTLMNWSAQSQSPYCSPFHPLPEPPPDGPVLVEEWRTVSLPLVISMTVLAVAGVLFVIFLLVINIMYRDRRYVNWSFIYRHEFLCIASTTQIFFYVCLSTVLPKVVWRCGESFKYQGLGRTNTMYEWKQ